MREILKLMELSKYIANIDKSGTMILMTVIFFLLLVILALLKIIMNNSKQSYNLRRENNKLLIELIDHMSRDRKKND